MRRAGERREIECELANLRRIFLVWKSARRNAQQHRQFAPRLAHEVPIFIRLFLAILDIENLVEQQARHAQRGTHVVTQEIKALKFVALIIHVALIWRMRDHALFTRLRSNPNWRSSVATDTRSMSCRGPTRIMNG